jgi:hypothetical protein
MADEPDAGDQSVVDAIMTTEEGPREPVVEGDEDPAPDDENPDEGDTPDEEGEGEGEEDEKKASAEDEPEEEVDVDDLLVEITINGQKQEIPLKELKQNYSGNEYIKQNIQKSVEVRKAVEYNAAALYQANQEVAGKLKSLNEVLDTLAQPAIDWDELRARNPNEYLLRREELREVQEKQILVAQEVERIEAEQAALQSQARQRVVLDQAQRLASILPDLADPKKAPVAMNRLIRTAEYCGIPQSEVEQVIDHRYMLVLELAARQLQGEYERSQVRQRANGNGDASAQTPSRKVVLRPGSSQGSAATSAKRLTAEVYNRAKRTGSVEDVAKTLIMSSPTRR